MQKNAETLGLHPQVKIISLNEFMTLKGYCITLFKETGIVVVEKWSKDRLMVYMPPFAPLLKSTKDLSPVWTSKMLFFQRTNLTPGAVYPRLATLTSIYDTGEVEASSPIEHIFEICNVGNSDLHLQRLETFCGCTTAFATPTVIHSGETGLVHVTVKEGSGHPDFSQSVLIETDDPILPVTQIQLNGSFYSELLSSPSAAFFDSISEHTGATQTIRLVQSSKNPTSILSITSDCPNVLTHLVQDTDGWAVEVMVEPRFAIGSYFCKLYIQYSHADSKKQLIIPVRIETVADYFAEPASIFLGQIKQGANKEVELEITSKNGQAFEVGSVQSDVIGLRAKPINGAAPSMHQHLSLYLCTNQPPGLINSQLTITLRQQEQSHQLIVPIYGLIK
ncbi:MAG: DUF1573 domain-containing protein [Chlorobiales bacterium]|nr:DUF1573 domain-containing protein [Chlorobiales bacterium]